jgi:hypothetical protein
MDTSAAFSFLACSQKLKKKREEKMTCNPKSHGPCFPNPVLQAPNSARTLGLMKGEVTNSRGL